MMLECYIIYCIFQEENQSKPQRNHPKTRNNTLLPKSTKYLNARNMFICICNYRLVSFKLQDTVLFQTRRHFRQPYVNSADSNLEM